ncbi:MAG: ATPase [Escherichia coli]|nr:MAG: ATPase [Escherichia coli]
MISPLADRMRPQGIDDVVGQRHILAPGKPLRNMIDSGNIPNLIFYGPSGVGKTTVASIIAKKTNRALRKLNGTTAKTEDIKQIVAELDTFSAPNGVLLYLDEIQYFNKKQQQSLLEYIENGKITLIASTTENPYFYIYNAVLSRSTVFEFKSVDWQDIEIAVKRGIEFLEEENSTKITVEDGVAEYLAKKAGGDVRRALLSIENCVVASGGNVKLDFAKEMVQSGGISFDKKGDEMYDTMSAFQKSMRGSDPDAAVFYLAKLLSAGDLITACRRLMVCACEDVGLAYPQIIPIVKAAVDSAMMLGLPEARIPLADATLLVATSPKSNSAYNAINSAMADVEAGKGKVFPRALQNVHFDGDDVKEKGQFYKYPHDYPNHWTEQQYLPDDLKNKKYYFPCENKNETAFNSNLEKMRGKK